jgi:membrane-bound serine protease (ClpP class)
MRRLFNWLLLVGFALGALVSGAWAQTPAVAVLEIKGAINPMVASYVDRGLKLAAERNAGAVVIQLDTPGGLDTSMREIIQDMIGSPLPVIVYVSPQGGRAASAGAFITLAAHVAAMAPNTAIGAAHPVAGGGEEIKGAMGDKVTNDAAAYIKGLAKERGRNAEWAEKAVRQSVSASADEAKRLGVIDLVAPNLPSLLDQVHGREVKVGDRTVTLQTRGATTLPLEMTTLERFLYTISDPSIAFILLNLGMLGIFFELSNPGAIFPGILGGICLLLAFFALGMLPVNYVGVALIVLAFIMFVLELFVVSAGALTIGGLIALIFGASMLIDPSTPGIAVSLPVILTVTLVTASLMTGAMIMAIKTRRRKVTTGREDLIGAIAEVRTPLDPKGYVFLEGELWSAVTRSGRIDPPAHVTIVALEGLTLTVEPLSSPHFSQETP